MEFGFWLIFFRETSIWSTWFINEVLDGCIDNYWMINTKQKYSWLTNHLILQRELVHPWIRMKIGNGERCYYWTSNWSPFGKISAYLGSGSLIRSGVPRQSTLAELWSSGSWNLPPAHSEEQVNVYSYLSTLQLTCEIDSLERWSNNVKRKRFNTGEIYHLISHKGPEVTKDRMLH